MISRSSTYSENHTESGKALERHKAEGTPSHQRIKNNKAKTFNYASCVICQIQNKDNDRFITYEIRVKTTFSQQHANTTQKIVNSFLVYKAS